MFSLGVAAFVVMPGGFPFAGRTERDKRMLFRFTKGQCQMRPEHWEGVSEEGKQFVQALLQVDPSKRLTAEQALLHPWMAANAHTQDADISTLAELGTAILLKLK